MTLRDESFEYACDLCTFVNEHKVKVEQICIVYNKFYLFYWE